MIPNDKSTVTNMANRRACMAAVVACLMPLVIMCGDDGGGLGIAYDPPVTFKGYINGEWYELPGHQAYPNQCRRDHDTLKLRMCSDDYSAGQVPTGVLMKLDIFPLHDDTLFSGHDTVVVPHQNVIETREVRFHLVSHTYMTCSYYVLPRDSLNLGTGFAATFESLRRTYHAPIELTDIQANAKAEGTFCGRELELEQGTIEGRVE